MTDTATASKGASFVDWLIRLLLLAVAIYLVLYYFFGIDLRVRWVPGAAAVITTNTVVTASCGNPIKDTASANRWGLNGTWYKMDRTRPNANEPLCIRNGLAFWKSEL